jgi:hypothetical protein
MPSVNPRDLLWMRRLKVLFMELHEARQKPERDTCCIFLLIVRVVGKGWHRKLLPSYTLLFHPISYHCHHSSSRRVAHTNKVVSRWSLWLIRNKQLSVYHTGLRPQGEAAFQRLCQLLFCLKMVKPLFITLGYNFSFFLILLRQGREIVFLKISSSQEKNTQAIFPSAIKMQVFTYLGILAQFKSRVYVYVYSFGQ